MELTAEVIVVLKDAAQKLTGVERRQFMAQATQTLLAGSARQAERLLGWGRATVPKGLQEWQTGFRCLDDYAARGNKKTEDRWPQLPQDIRDLVDPQSQAEPRFKNSLAYTRITAQAVRHALITEKGYPEAQLPTTRTISTMLNRLGYRLRRVQKTKPVKKIPEVDDIFDNVHQENQHADQTAHSLRISLDAKARLKIGPFSRQGRARGPVARQGVAHDIAPTAHLIVFGILAVAPGAFHIVFGTSCETTDFIVDALQSWWAQHHKHYPHIQELVINLDNGPHVQSHRTQFIKRMVAFADQNGLRIRLIYYPPYHSKYNPIEHCWGRLEQHWNGEILDSTTKAIEWAKTMTWRGVQPTVDVVETVYENGIKVTKKELEQYAERFKRSATLPKWDITIDPQPG